MTEVIYDFLDPAAYEADPAIIVANGTARLLSPYATDNPAVIPNDGVFINKLIGIEVESNIPSGTDIKHVLEIDGTDYWWDGGAWIESEGYSESNSIADINEYCDEIEILDGDVELRIKSYLNSNGLATPTLNNIVLQVETIEDALDPVVQCKVWGFIKDSLGNPIEGVKVQAKLLYSAICNNQLIVTAYPVYTSSRSDGYFELSLVNNEHMKYFQNIGLGKPYYIFEFKGPGIEFTENCYVPALTSKQYLELERLIGGGAIYEQN